MQFCNEEEEKFIVWFSNFAFIKLDSNTSTNYTFTHILLNRDLCKKMYKPKKGELNLYLWIHGVMQKRSQLLQCISLFAFYHKHGLMPLLAYCLTYFLYAKIHPKQTCENNSTKCIQYPFYYY